ncbi:MAG: fibronectin type III domain-containing protein [Bacteroidales bacterium]|nr:fibronectin type III domain-containing protein [Bacteroidales bacterium]
MKTKHLLFLLLFWTLVPWAAKAQNTLFSENFEGLTGLPNGWTTDGPGTWMVGTGDHHSGTGAGEGSQNALIKHENVGNITKLITPEIDLSSTDFAELSFMHIERKWENDIDELKVYYRSSSTSEWHLLLAYTEDVPTWTTESEVLLPNLSSTYQIAFEAIDKYGYGVGIDNVIITSATFSCPIPTDLHCTEITPSTATIAWTQIGDIPSWQLCINDDETNLTEITSNPYTITGLTTETIYYAKVRANCGDEQSAWSNILKLEPTQKIIIGSGSVTNSYLPTSIYHNYSLTEQIFTPEELGSAGSILSIDFYKKGYATKSRSLDIYMVNTELNTISGFIPVNENNLVFSGSVNFAAQEWSTITLNTPFEYDGTSNVLLVVDDNTGSWEQAEEFLVFQTSTQQAIRGADDNYNFSPTGSIDYSNQVLYNYKNQIRILKETKPSNLVCTATTAGTATLQWTDNTDATAWQICLNNDENNLIEATSNPFTITGLNGSTNYTAKVRSNFGESQSAWSESLSFSTSCGIATFPWKEDFNSYGNDFTPQYGPCWNYVNTNNSHRNFRIENGALCLPHGETSGALNGTFCRLRLPVLTLPSDNYAFSFDIYRESSTKCEVKVYVSQNGSIDGLEPLLYISSNYSYAGGFYDNDPNAIAPPESGAGWYTYSINIPYSGTCYVILACGSDWAGQGYTPKNLYLDNFSIREVPNELAVSNITTSSANISWTPASDETEWLVQYGNYNSFFNGTFQQVSVSGNPSVTLTNLSSVKRYYVRVKAVYGSEKSGWSVPLGFDMAPRYTVGRLYTLYSYLPIKCYNSNTYSQQIYTPEDLGDAGIIRSIDFYRDGTSPCNRNLDIYMVNTDKNAFESNTDWITVNTGNRVFSSTVNFSAQDWTSIELSQPFNYDGLHNVAIIVHDKTGAHQKSSYFYVIASDGNQALSRSSYDNAIDPSSPGQGSLITGKSQIRLAKDYPEPSNLQCTATTTTTATVTWTENGTADYWQICLNNDESNLVTCYSKPYTLTGLQPDSTYSFKVRSMCEHSELNSPWSYPGSFTTEPTCLAPVGLGVVNKVATWEAGEASQWNLKYKALSETEWTLVNGLTEPTYTFTGLPNSIVYEVQVQADCGNDGTSRWSSTTFNVPIPMPYAYNFESESEMALWTIANEASYTRRSDEANHTSNGSWSFEFYYNYTPPQYLISPEFETSEDGLNVSFYYTNESNNWPETFCVGYSTTTKDLSAFTWGEEITAQHSGEWKLCVRDFPAGTRFVAIKYTSYDKFKLFLDDFILIPSRIIGSGDETNTDLPTNVSAKYSLTQQIYTADELGDEGVIWSISFYKDGTASCGQRDLDIYLIPTEKDHFDSPNDWIDFSNTYPRFSGIVTFNNNDWTTIELGGENAYLHDGMKNMAVIVNDKTAAQESESVSFRSFQTETNRAIHISRNDQAFSAQELSTCSGTPTTAINQFRIQRFHYCVKPASPTLVSVDRHNATLAWDVTEGKTYQCCLRVEGSESPSDEDYITLTEPNNTISYDTLTPGTWYTFHLRVVCGEDDYSSAITVWFSTLEACPTPYNINATTTSNSALLTWDSDYADQWNIRYMGNMDEDWIVIEGVTDSIYLLENLEPNNNYNLEIQADCDSDGQSDWVYFTFNTLCAAPDLPYTESFESGYLDCWFGQSQYSGTPSVNSYDAVHTGNYTLVFDPVQFPPQYVFSPELDDQGQGLYVSFWTRNYYVDNTVMEETFYIGYSTTTCEVDAFEWGEPIVSDDYEWTFYEMNFPPGTKFVAIKLATEPNDHFNNVGWVLFDDFTFDFARCVHVSCDAVTATTATLSWSGLQESFNIRYGSADDDIFSTDFETGIPDEFATDELGWILWDDVTNNGSLHSIASNNSATHSSTATISLTETVEDTCKIEFYSLISSETNYDFGIFEIDGEEKLRESGSGQDWVKHSFEVGAGTHTFTWKYTKDSSVSSGDDRYYIDDIKLTTIPTEWDAVIEGIEGTTYTLRRLRPNTNYRFEVQGVIPGSVTGTPWSQPVYFTTQDATLVTQSLTLEEGWNWVSIYIEADDPVVLLQMLEEALAENATQISSAELFTENDEGDWWGDLDEEGVTNEQMFMILVETPCTIELEGLPANPADHAITINPGWNWIGFPCDYEMTIEEALGGFDAEEGDLFANSEFFTEFDGEWYGDVETLSPGQGFMYFSNSDETKTLIIGSSKGRRR